VVPNVGVGGGKGLLVRKSGWICDSRREGTELLLRRIAFGFSVVGDLEYRVPTDKLRTAECLCAGSSSMLCLGKGPSRRSAPETGRLPGMGDNLMEILKADFPELITLFDTSDAK